MRRFTIKDLFILTALVAVEVAFLIVMMPLPMRQSSVPPVVQTVAWIGYGALLGVIVTFRHGRRSAAAIGLACILGMLFQCIVLAVWLSAMLNLDYLQSLRDRFRLQ